MRIPDRLYARIVRTMPVPCVDVVVQDRRGRVLMLKRSNPPARNQWWFPGGRVHYRETRREAARRKLREECGLRPAAPLREMGTFEVLFCEEDRLSAGHCVSTVFATRVKSGRVTLDAQSAGYAWRPPGVWLAQVRHPFLKRILRLLPTPG